MRLGNTTKEFLLLALDKNGNVVDVSHYEPNSLLSAALVGHVFQIQDGYTVTIIDNTEELHRQYKIDGAGKPVQISLP